MPVSPKSYIIFEPTNEDFFQQIVNNYIETYESRLEEAGKSLDDFFGRSYDEKIQPSNDKNKIDIVIDEYFKDLYFPACEVLITGLNCKETKCGSNRDVIFTKSQEKVLFDRINKSNNKITVADRKRKEGQKKMGELVQRIRQERLLIKPRAKELNSIGIYEEFDEDKYLEVYKRKLKEKREEIRYAKGFFYVCSKTDKINSGLEPKTGEKPFVECTEFQKIIT